MVGELVEIVVGVWVVKAFGEAVDEDSWVWSLHLDLWIGSIGMVDWEEYITSRCILVCSARFGKCTIVWDQERFAALGANN